VKVVDVLDRAAAQLDADFDGPPVIKGELLDALGQTYIDLGLPARAVEVLTQARGVLEAALGPHHLHTLETCGNLAMAYDAAGRTAEAIKLYEGTLELKEAKLV
jgi:tetratricopeptide (TPR) repeat protein